MSLNLLLQYLLPQHILSRLVAKIANCRLSLIKNFIIKRYYQFYHIDMTEAVAEDYRSYPTFNDFFTRALKPGVRPITSDKKAIISPVDGTIWQIGQVKGNTINAKGRGFTLAQVLADSRDAARFSNANFAVLYLAPYNYHRIHMPLTGKLLAMRYIPGKLFSVNPLVAEHIPDVFARNERVVTIFDTALGPMAVIFVGAIIVGSIETQWEGVVTTASRGGIANWQYDGQMTIESGVEIGKFKLGSTVILLFPQRVMKWHENLQPGMSIKMGQSLGSFNSQ